MDSGRGEPWRAGLAVVAGAAVAAAGALLLGEYNFDGAPIFAGAALLGLFVAEAVIAVGTRRGLLPAVASIVLAGAGLVWAAWISSGRDLAQLPTEGWAAVAVGAVAAGIMAAWPSRVADSRPAPAETE
ncbi:MAG TPA: hypothetical protein VM121_03525 [Acidimicrobiales bacterium]|nr:hypothetical protein [Acidimicrobiales bacterium]